ncbi:MAG: DUF1127 domain-containing protein [Rhodobacteraceae bacterium]|nr:DUF1127 domain-containing protein [Paracoccaceae bacterium]
MAYANVGKSSYQWASALVPDLRSSLDRVREGYERRQSYLKIVRELVAMSDRDLADIGIRRDDIHDVAKGGQGRTIV